MSTKNGPAHVVVDGSNIATEGRSMPSLSQLSEAVGGFMEEHPDTAITVVVDATFGHRIDKREIPEFEAGISNNELVAPPAGAVGRGDAFVLGIADKAGASVLSNDSFQEFHGEYTWLFDEGRLIGGKPVPHVGWVWVERVPVRGPISRKATRGSGGPGGSSRRSSGGRSRRGSSSDEHTVRTGSKEASGPMPTPKTPPPTRVAKRNADSEAASPRAEAGSADTSKRGRRSSATSKIADASPKPVPKGGDPVNDLMPFLDFVEQHPAGTNVTGVVDAYSSHGAYIAIADTGVRGYVPLRLMADPVPRSAKSIMKIGESVDVVVVSFAAARRSIDCALPDLATAAIAAATEEGEDTTASEVSAALDADGSAATKKSATGRKSAAKKAATKKSTAKKKAPTKKAAAAKSAAPKQPAAEKTSARKTATSKQSAATKTAATKAPARKAVAKKAAATKAPAEKAIAKKAAATSAAATKKTATKKAATKKAATKKAATKKTVTKKAATKKAATKKAATKKAATKKAPAKKSAGTRPEAG